MPTLICENCLSLFEHRTGKPSKHGAFCKEEECRKAYLNKRQRAWNAEHPGYYSNSPSRKRVKEERAAGRRPHWRQRYPEMSQAQDQRRRALKAGVDAERIVSNEVYERDDWICRLCFFPVDPALQYPEPQSASLDHIVPLSKGGPHRWDNVQLAHLGCNIDKKAALPVTADDAGQDALSSKEHSGSEDKIAGETPFDLSSLPFEIEINDEMTR